jgi:hypothetical protein
MAFNKLFPTQKDKMNQTLGPNRFKDFRKKMLSRVQRHSIIKPHPEITKPLSKGPSFKRNKTLG